MGVLAEMQPNIFELQHQFEIRSKKNIWKLILSALLFVVTGENPVVTR